MAGDTVKRLARHLEFLGYAPTGPGDGGWWHAAHPRRCNIYFLGTPMGLRLRGVFYLGKAVTTKRRAWLEFVNRFNEESVVARASLWIDDEGDAFLRTRALLPPAYERRLHGALLDAWHSDLEFMAQAPTQEDTRPLAQENETVN